jgi:hypothetical protein
MAEPGPVLWALSEGRIRDVKDCCSLRRSQPSMSEKAKEVILSSAF